MQEINDAEEEVGIFEEAADFPSELDASLMNAVWAGDRDEIDGLIEKGANINAKTYGDEPMLALAARHATHRASGIRGLLRDGIQVNAVGPDGKTALHHAIESDSHGEVDALVFYGADVNVKDGKGRTPLDLVYEASVAVSDSVIGQWMEWSVEILNGQKPTSTEMRMRILKMRAQQRAFLESYGALTSRTMKRRKRNAKRRRFKSRKKAVSKDTRTSPQVL